MLHFSTFGNPQAPAIAVMHGLFGMSDNLKSLATMLSEHYFVVTPDLTNHGKSFHQMMVDYPIMADHVIALIEYLSIKKLSLFGHSMGGKVAMQVAEKIPESVERLIIADIAPVTYEARHLEILDQMFVVANTAIKQRKEADDLLARKIPEAPLRQFFMKNMKRNDEGLWVWRFGLEEVAASYEAICAAPSLTKAYEGPVLFIRGELSDYVLPSMKDTILHFYPHVQLRTLQGAGHWLHAEKPLAFNQQVLRFLQQQ